MEYERTIQSISLSEVDKEEPEQEIIEFAEWIGKNTLAYNNGKFRMKTLTPVFLTSEELLELFKKK